MTNNDFLTGGNGDTVLIGGRGGSDGDRDMGNSSGYDGSGYESYDSTPSYNDMSQKPISSATDYNLVKNQTPKHVSTSVEQGACPAPQGIMDRHNDYSYDRDQFRADCHEWVTLLKGQKNGNGYDRAGETCSIEYGGSATVIDKNANGYVVEYNRGPQGYGAQCGNGAEFAVSEHQLSQFSEVTVAGKHLVTEVQQSNPSMDIKRDEPAFDFGGTEMLIALTAVGAYVARKIFFSGAQELDNYSHGKPSMPVAKSAVTIRPAEVRGGLKATFHECDGCGADLTISAKDLGSTVDCGHCGKAATVERRGVAQVPLVPRHSS